MSLMHDADFKRVARQICARFPGWQIEKVLLQETNRTVFRLRKGEQAAQLHAVCFADGAAAGRVASLWRETAAVRSYAAWVRRLCGIRDAECLALPVQCEVTPFSIRCGGRRVLVLQPGLTPLCRANRLPPDAAVMADVFQTVCRALLQCRVGGFPHGALVASNLLQRADGRYCLGGMLDPQRPEERGQPLPPESVELQRAALLMKELCGDSLQAETHDPGAMALQELIERAAVGEKGLFLRRVIDELDAVRALLRQSADGGTDFTGLRENRTDEAQDPERTVCVHARKQGPTPSDPDRTVGVRSASAAPPAMASPHHAQPSCRAAASIPEDADATVRTR